MKKIFTTILLTCTCFLNAAVHADPYPTDSYFSGFARVKSNVLDLCQATAGVLTYKITQKMLDSTPGNTLTSCTENELVRVGDKFLLYFDVVMNDGSGKVATPCEIKFENNMPNQRYHVANRSITLSKDNKTVTSCNVNIS
jgi:hypothetical protein